MNEEKVSIWCSRILENGTLTTPVLEIGDASKTTDGD